MAALKREYQFQHGHSHLFSSLGVPESVQGEPTVNRCNGETHANKVVQLFPVKNFKHEN